MKNPPIIMKKLTFIFTILILSSITCIISCKDKKEEPQDLKPTISFKTGGSFISSDTTLNAQQEFSIGITVSRNATSQKNLSRLTISRSYNNVVWSLWDTTLNTANFTFNFNFKSLGIATTERIVFTVTDTEGQKSEILLNITTLPDLKPTIDFKTDASYISTDTTINSDQEFSIGIIASCNAVSGANLASLQITRTIGNNTWYSWDTTFNMANINLDFQFVSLSEVNTETIAVIVTDSDGQTKEISLNITTLPDLKPTINFKSGAAYISADATLNVDEEFLIGITASSNTVSGKNLANLKVTRTYNNAIWFVWDTTLNTAYFGCDFSFLALNVAGNETIAFKVTDTDGETQEIALNITTEETGGQINYFVQKILGAQQNINGCAFASSDGFVYHLADAKINSDKVDWVYFYGVISFAAIAAPDDVTAGTVYNDPVNGLQTWFVTNSTRFKKITTVVDWDAITNDATILQLTEEGVTESKINNLTVGDIIGFKTEPGKFGLIRVDNITGTSAGTIEISVKVQQ
jgi:5-hydroxyisourate hydrolase-like protein (transthyretin family)